jgi:hypothetical protein
MAWTDPELIELASTSFPMPTTFRFLLVCGLLAASIYGVLFLIASRLAPPQQDVITIVPPSRYVP